MNTSSELARTYKQIGSNGGTQSGTDNAMDGQLQELIRAWPTLPDEAKRAIRAIIESYERTE